MTAIIFGVLAGFTIGLVFGFWLCAVITCGHPFLRGFGGQDKQ